MLRTSACLQNIERHNKQIKEIAIHEQALTWDYNTYCQTLEER